LESMLMLFGLLTLVIAGVVAAGGLAGLNANIIIDIGKQGGFGSGGITVTSSDAWFLFPNALSMGMIGMGLVTTFGTWGSPQMSTRFFAAKSRKSIRYGMLIAALWVFVVSFCAWFAGYVGRGQFNTIGATQALKDWAASLNGGTVPKNWYEYSMPWMLSEAGFMPLWISALFLAGTTAASLTTGEKLILVASGSIARDFYQQGIAIKKNVSDEKTLKITRFSIVGIVVIAVIIAINPPATVLDLCMFSWASLNAFTLIPFIAGLYWKGGTRRAAWLSGIIALSVAILWFICFYPKWAPINGQAILPLFKPSTLPFIIETPWFKAKPGDIHEFIVSQVVAIPAFFLISWIDRKGKPDREFLNKLFDHIKKDTDE